MLISQSGRSTFPHAVFNAFLESYTRELVIIREQGNYSSNVLIESNDDINDNWKSDVLKLFSGSLCSILLG